MIILKVFTVVLSLFRYSELMDGITYNYLIKFQVISSSHGVQYLMHKLLVVVTYWYKTLTSGSIFPNGLFSISECLAFPSNYWWQEHGQPGTGHNECLSNHSSACPACMPWLHFKQKLNHSFIFNLFLSLSSLFFEFSSSSTSQEFVVPFITIGRFEVPRGSCLLYTSRCV